MPREVLLWKWSEVTTFWRGRLRVLTVAFFGSGGAGSMVPLEAVSRSHRVLAVVSPAHENDWLRREVRSLMSRIGIGQGAAMSRWARNHDVTLFRAASGRDFELSDRLKKLAPDVICVSAFPWLLGDEILGTARRSALNVHSSLLPRHRGPNPLLWIYYQDDRRTGVTVHRMNQRADAGESMKTTVSASLIRLPIRCFHFSPPEMPSRSMKHSKPQALSAATSWPAKRRSSRL